MSTHLSYVSYPLMWKFHFQHSREKNLSTPKSEQNVIQREIK